MRAVRRGVGAHAGGSQERGEFAVLEIWTVV